jgi:hypothetical protein
MTIQMKMMTTMRVVPTRQWCIFLLWRHWCNHFLPQRMESLSGVFFMVGCQHNEERAIKLVVVVSWFGNENKIHHFCSNLSTIGNSSSMIHCGIHFWSCHKPTSDATQNLRVSMCRINFTDLTHYPTVMYKLCVTHRHKYIMQDGLTTGAVTPMLLSLLHFKILEGEWLSRLLMMPSGCFCY